MQSSRSGALRFLGAHLSVTAAAAILVALLDSLNLMLRYQGGRPTDAGYAWLTHFIGLALEVDFFAGLPAVFCRYYELTSGAAFARFLGAAVPLNLALAIVFGVLLLPVALLLNRGLGKGWKPSALLGVWLLLLSPVVLHLATETSLPGLDRSEESLPVWVGLGLIVVLWLLLWWPVSRMSRFAGLSRFLVYAALTTGVVVTVGGNLARLSGPVEFPAADASRPNIVLISVDTLRADHLGCYGYHRDTSPNLDALAREGVMYRYAVAPSSWTLPSHVTMLTSLPPIQHRLTADFTRFRPEAVTLAEVLKEAGYRTAGFVSGLYLMSEYRYQQGFDLYNDYTAMPLPWNAHSKITSPTLVREVTSWLDEWDRNGRERPFFLFVHMWDPHYDFAPPAPYDTMFDPDYTGTMTSENFEGNAKIRRDMNPRDLEHIVALYDGEIRYTDEYIGKLFDFMRERGIFDKSVIAVTGDHGEEFFEHGQKGHRKTLYDEVLLVPLILRYPDRLPGGQVVSDQVRLLDIAPTLLSLSGIEQPESFGMSDGNPEEFGRDITSWIVNQTAAPPAPAAHGVMGWNMASVRTNEWKLISLVDGDPRPELYNLTDDPGEQTNLSSQETARLDRLHTQILEFRKSGGRHQLSEQMEVDREHLAALKSLGYLTDFIEDAINTSVEMHSPAPGSHLKESTVTFEWSADGEVEQYYLKVGSGVNVEDIYGRDQSRRTSTVVTDIPLDGRDIHVRLFHRAAGSKKWLHRDFVYKTGEDENAPCTATVTLTNLTRGGTTFHAGDRFRVEVRGAPEQAVWVKGTRNGRTAGEGYGRTNSEGVGVVEGVMPSNLVGHWEQVWRVGRACAEPTLEFDVLPASDVN